MADIVILNAVPDSCELELLSFPPDDRTKLRCVVESNMNAPTVESGITTVQPRSQDVHVEKRIDIVLVHGLEGDPFMEIGNTVWRKPTSKTIWVRDMLPEKLNFFKLHLYQYKTESLAQAFGEELNRHIRSHATRLLKSIYDTFEELETKPNIVLMGNGLGGLIVKQALVYCGSSNIIDHKQKPPSPASNSGDNPIGKSPSSLCFKFAKQHIAGVIFIGTPHRGWKTGCGDTYYTSAKDPNTTDYAPRVGSYHNSRMRRTSSIGNLSRPPAPTTPGAYTIVELSQEQPIPQILGPAFQLVDPQTTSEGEPVPYLDQRYRRPRPTIRHIPVEPLTKNIQPNNHADRQRRSDNRSHSYAEHNAKHQPPPPRVSSRPRSRPQPEPKTSRDIASNRTVRARGFESRSISGGNGDRSSRTIQASTSLKHGSDVIPPANASTKVEIRDKVPLSTRKGKAVSCAEEEEEAPEVPPVSLRSSSDDEREISHRPTVRRGNLIGWQNNIESEYVDGSRSGKGFELDNIRSNGKSLGATNTPAHQKPSLVASSYPTSSAHPPTGPTVMVVTSPESPEPEQENSLAPCGEEIAERSSRPAVVPSEPHTPPAEPKVWLQESVEVCDTLVLYQQPSQTQTPLLQEQSQTVKQPTLPSNQPSDPPPFVQSYPLSQETTDSHPSISEPQQAGFPATQQTAAPHHLANSHAKGPSPFNPVTESQSGVNLTKYPHHPHHPHRPPYPSPSVAAPSVQPSQSPIYQPTLPVSQPRRQFQNPPHIPSFHSYPPPLSSFAYSHAPSYTPPFTHGPPRTGISSLPPGPHYGASAPPPPPQHPQPYYGASAPPPPPQHPQPYYSASAPPPPSESYYGVSVPPSHPHHVSAAPPAPLPPRAYSFLNPQPHHSAYGEHSSRPHSRSQRRRSVVFREDSTREIYRYPQLSTISDSESGELEESGSEGEYRLIIYQDHMNVLKTQDDLWKQYVSIRSDLEREVRCRKWDLRHRAESAFLQRLWDDFSKVCDSYEILSVFSETESPESPDMTVGKHSALLNKPSETFLVLERRQDDLVRYECREEKWYLQLEDAICTIVNNARSKSLAVEPEAGQLSQPASQRLGQLAGLDPKVLNLLEKHYPFEKDIPADTLAIAPIWDPRPAFRIHKVKQETCLLRHLGERYLWSDCDNENQDGYLWVHVPGNDRSWAEAIVPKVHNLRSSNVPLQIMSDDCWKNGERKHTCERGFTYRYMHPSCNTLWSSEQRSPQLVLYLPYLHWSKDEDQKEQASVLEAFHSHENLRDSYYQARNDPSRRLRIFSLADCDDDSPDTLRHHPRRTLDQFYYHSIDTKARDNDQIVSYGTEKLLMVDQLWVCVTSPDTIFTFFPQNPVESDRDYEFADLKKSLVHGLKQNSLTKDNFFCEDAFDMAAYCLYHAVAVLLDHRHSSSDLAVMRIFRNTLEKTSDDAVKAFDSFIINPDANLDVGYELKLLQKASDLRDELRILRHLFSEQRVVIDKFLREVRHRLSCIYGKNAVSLAKRALTKLDEYDYEAKKHHDEADTIRDYILALLDLKQKGAGLEVARGTAEQGRIMMIFTVFTIVFLPLSFFTSLYGMNIREWSGQRTNLAAKTAMVYMAPISTVVIFLALVVAFFGKLRRLVRRCWGRDDRGGLYSRVSQEDTVLDNMRRRMRTTRRGEGYAIV